MTVGLARDLKDGEFQKEVLQSGFPVLVCFHAELSGLGTVIRRIAENVAKELSGKVRVVLMDTDKARETAKSHAVLTVPTYTLFRNGQKVVTAVGYQRESDILKLVARFVGQENSPGPAGK